MKTHTQPYHDRREAGIVLAAWLRRYAERDDVVVLGVPRGGVPVAYEVARFLSAPFDVFSVRKLGVPGHDEFAMGAIGSGGTRVLNYDVIDGLHISHAAVAAAAEREQHELEGRERAYRDSRPFPQIEGKTVILIDDGIATGASTIVALAVLRERGPERIVVAVPVATEETLAVVRERADEVVCPLRPEHLHSVSTWYHDFSQVEDAEVRELLAALPGTPAERHRRDVELLEFAVHHDTTQHAPRLYERAVQAIAPTARSQQRRFPR